MEHLNTIFFAILIGVVPSIVWLLFWLREDKKKPEPKRMILFSFIAGMLAVIIVLPIERFAHGKLDNQLALLTVWSAIEEIVKFLIILIVALRSRYFDEPIDAVIYLITVALGFAALENALFVSNPLITGDLVGGVSIGNMRFVGATLLHLTTCSVIGIFLAFSFYKSKIVKIFNALLGLSIAILLHTMFNYFIMNGERNDTFIIFGIVWILVVAIIFIFEKIKRIKR